eukprot:scaffold109826_cov55-Phaeocystis_antarctica.AAC.2
MATSPAGPAHTSWPHGRVREWERERESESKRFRFRPIDHLENGSESESSPYTEGESLQLSQKAPMQSAWLVLL